MFRLFNEAIRDENKDWNNLSNKVVLGAKIVFAMWVLAILASIGFLGFVCWVVYVILKYNGVV